MQHLLSSQGKPAWTTTWEKGEDSHFGHFQPFCSYCKPFTAPRKMYSVFVTNLTLTMILPLRLRNTYSMGGIPYHCHWSFPFSFKTLLLFLVFYALIKPYMLPFNFSFLYLWSNPPAVTTELVSPFWLKGFIKNYSRLCQPTLTKMAFDFISVQMLTSACGFLAFIGCDINIHTAILASICFPFCTKWRIQ